MGENGIGCGENGKGGRENGKGRGIWGDFFLLFWIFFVFLLRGNLYLLLISC